MMVSCKAKAMDLLARSDQSIRRLTEKLQHREYSEEEIQETMAWLEAQGFIKEAEGCQRRAEFLYHNSSYSLRQIKVKLRQQGYEGDMVEEFLPEDSDERERETALKVIRRKYKPGTDKRKMYQHLCQKGFGYDVARYAVETLAEEWEMAEDL